MPRSSREATKKHKSRPAGCKAFCCGCRLSVSSSEEPESSNNSDRFATISSIAHAMVQERLDQMIREKREARVNHEEMRITMRRREAARREEKKFVIMMAMEKPSYDPREDFRESMKQMIVANRICEAKDLRRLLSYYVTMNSEEFRGVILEVFHQVCTDLFLYCK
ncbi:probable transcription repressor OFP9 [Henckelia pumila]|uniref:probable transcription repressor OFP9 n=1 Tax=Henckelia pumila TaxID=405737 RepID=UPI003C6E2EBE